MLGVCPRTDRSPGILESCCSHSSSLLPATHWEDESPHSSERLCSAHFEGAGEAVCSWRGCQRPALLHWPPPRHSICPAASLLVPCLMWKEIHTKSKLPSTAPSVLHKELPVNTAVNQPPSSTVFKSLPSLCPFRKGKKTAFPPLHLLLKLPKLAGQAKRPSSWLCLKPPLVCICPQASFHHFSFSLRGRSRQVSSLLPHRG